MHQVRRWFHKPKKDVEDGTRPSLVTSSGAPEAALAMETQKQEVCAAQWGLFHPQYHLTATAATAPPWTSASLPVWRSQVERVTGEDGVIRLSATDSGSPTPDAGGDAVLNEETSLPPSPLPVRPLLRRRFDSSLPASPHPGGRRPLPCSLPCSPLLGGRSWSPSPRPHSTRLRVEAALQRSKNARHAEPRPLQPRVQQEDAEEEEAGRRREAEEWSDDEEDQPMRADNAGRTRLSGAIVLTRARSLTSGGRRPEEEEEEHEEPPCLDADSRRYCLLTPCVCSRCPSAPPYEGQDFPAFNPDAAWRGGQAQGTDLRGTEGAGEQTSPRGPGLYPSLSPWGAAADAQEEPSGKGKQEVGDPRLCCSIRPCFHGNACDAHLRRLCAIISGGADQSLPLKRAPECTTCAQVTGESPAHPAGPGDPFGVRIAGRHCWSCCQVFCCHLRSIGSLNLLDSEPPVAQK